MSTVAGQVVLCHAAGAVDKTILRLIIFFIRIRELRMVTESVADTKVFIGGSRHMARFLNDFFLTVCGADDRFVHVVVCVVFGSCVFEFFVDNHRLLGVLCAVAHSGQKIDQKNDSRNYRAANNRLSELPLLCHECVYGSYDHRNRY